MQTEVPDKLEGWLLKKGDKGLVKGYKKRWFTLQANRLFYYVSPGEQPLGFVDILAASAIVPAFPTPSNASSSTKNSGSEFQIVTPQRTYALLASSEQEMRQWVAALDGHRQRLIRQSREAGHDPASLRRGSVGSNFPSSTSPLSSAATTSGAIRAQPQQTRRHVHTMTPQQGRQFEIGRRATTTAADPVPAASSLPNSSPMTSPSAVMRELSGLSLQSGSNRRSALSSSQTLLAVDDAVERSGASDATTNVRNSFHGGTPGAQSGEAVQVSMELAEENKKLRLKIAELENDLDEREGIIRDLKQEVMKDLRALNDKHRQRDEEMRILREELAFARQKLGELAPATLATPTEGESAVTGETDKDSLILEQQKQIAALRAQLQERTDDEAVQMKEKVRLTIEKLKQEQLEQIRAMTQQRTGASTDGSDNKTEQQLREENAILREEVKRVVEKMDALVRKGNQLLLEVFGIASSDDESTLEPIAPTAVTNDKRQEQSAVDSRDAEIERLQRLLAEKEAQAAQKDTMLAEKDALIARLRTVPSESSNSSAESSLDEKPAQDAVPSSVITYGGRKVALSVPDPEEKQAQDNTADNDSDATDNDEDSSEEELTSDDENSEEEAEEEEKNDNLLRAEAIYDFTARNENEISFVKGEILSILDKDASGWWKAMIRLKKRKENADEAEQNPRVGLVPSNYLRVLYQPPTFNFKLSSKVNQSILELQKKCGFVTAPTASEKASGRKKTSGKRRSRTDKARRQRRSRSMKKQASNKITKESHQTAVETIASIQRQLLEQKGFLAKQMQALQQARAIPAVEIDEAHASDSSDANPTTSSDNYSSGTLVHLTRSRPLIKGKRPPSRRAKPAKSEVETTETSEPKPEEITAISPSEEIDDEALDNLANELDAIADEMSGFDLNQDSEEEETKADETLYLADSVPQDEENVQHVTDDSDEEVENVETNTEAVVNDLKWRLARADEVIEANRVELEMAKEKEMILRLEMRSISLEQKSREAEIKLEKERAEMLAAEVAELTTTVKQMESELALWRKSSRRSATLVQPPVTTVTETLSDSSNTGENDESKPAESQPVQESTKAVDVEALMAEILERNKRVEELEQEVQERGSVIERLMMEVRSREEEKEQERDLIKLEHDAELVWWETERLRLLSLLDSSSADSSAGSSIPSSAPAAAVDIPAVASEEKPSSEASSASDGNAGHPAVAPAGQREPSTTADEVGVWKTKAQLLEEDRAARKEEDMIGEELIKLQARLIEQMVDMVAAASAGDSDPATRGKQKEEVRLMLEELEYLTQKRAMLVITRKEMRAKRRQDKNASAQPLEDDATSVLVLSSTESIARARKRTMLGVSRRSMFPSGSRAPPLPATPEDTTASSEGAPSPATATDTSTKTTSSTQTLHQPALEDGDDAVSALAKPIKEKKLKKQVEKMAKKKMEGRDTQAEAGPEWVPDVMVPVCFGCRANFTLIKRRHHCRHCGKVYCAKCTSLSCSIEELGYSDPVRVCDPCFQDLQARQPGRKGSRPRP